MLVVKYFEGSNIQTEGNCKSLDIQNQRKDKKNRQTNADILWSNNARLFAVPPVCLGLVNFHKSILM
jgi:hypothetical protein